MAEWLLVVPRERGATPVAPNAERVAAALGAQPGQVVAQCEIDGAFFWTLSESPDDPGPVRAHGGPLGPCVAIASALLTEREELAARLREHGRRADAGTPDGALLAAAFAQWGQDAWRRPGGEFAIAAWRPQRRAVQLAVDGEGARAAFWANAPAAFVASTRFEAVHAVPAVPVTPDRLGIAAHLALIRGAPDWGVTWLSGIEELPPGHALEWVADGTQRRRRWWNFPADTAAWRPKCEREITDRFRETLRQSVRERLRGHQRVAIALTGGMDSTAVAAEAAALRNSGELPLSLTAVHAVYAEELRSSEASFARAAAAALGVPMRAVPIGDAPAWPEPWSPLAWPPHHWFGLRAPLAAEAARCGSIALSGASGELFAFGTLGDAVASGRPLDLLTAWRTFARIGLPFSFRSRSSWIRPRRPLATAVVEAPAWVRRDALASLGADDVRGAMARWRPPGTPGALSSMCAYLMLQRRSSRMLEAGCDRIKTVNPFADRRVVQLAAAVPAVPWRLRKCLARRALSGVLPAELLRRSREPTPWLTERFLRSGAAEAVARGALHPMLGELVDVARWRGSLADLHGFTDGYGWILVAAVDAWLGAVNA